MRLIACTCCVCYDCFTSLCSLEVLDQRMVHHIRLLLNVVPLLLLFVRRVAKATGATIVGTLADMEGNETFDPVNLGTAEEVTEERVADDSMIMIKGAKTSRAATILLRGANDYMLDEMDRSLHDALCTVKRVLESGAVVPGRGCVVVLISTIAKQKHKWWVFCIPSTSMQVYCCPHVPGRLQQYAPVAAAACSAA